MSPETLNQFDDSLSRCHTNPRFLDLFYEKFLSSSEDVREKFKNTDFRTQKRALRASFYLIMLAAEDEENGPEKYLKDLAIVHDAEHLDVGAGLYDLWLDSLLATVAECDPEHNDNVAQIWEDVAMVGVSYLCSNYR
ncbi:MAG: hypothetical protein QF886_09890 [Planctomycetota bacterium]|nr:hypothetical protein [Planctomycetota bacterium]